MRSDMKGAALMFLLAIFAMVTACSDVTAPKQSEPDLGWMVTLTTAEGLYSGSGALAVKTNSFDTLSVRSFSYGKQAVVQLKNNSDTVWVGTSMSSGFYGVSSAKLGSKLSWSYTGTMALKKESPRLWMGAPVAISTHTIYLSSWDKVVESADLSKYISTQPLTIRGDDFRLDESILNKDSIFEVDRTLIIYRPVVCKDEVSTTVLASKNTESFGDSSSVYLYTKVMPEMTISCMRPAPEANRIPSVQSFVLGDRLIDHLGLATGSRERLH